MAELLPGHRVIEEVARGTLNDPEVLELILGVQQLQRETGIGDTLLDCSALTKGPDAVPLVALADRASALGLEAHWRQAIVRPRDTWAAMAVSRWQAVATNRGMVVELFRDRDEALAWLTAGAAVTAPGGSGAQREQGPEVLGIDEQH